MIEYLLLDLDNTLYPKSSGLEDFIRDRMAEFVVRHLELPPDRAAELRSSGLARHGTTLRWLVEEHDLSEVEEFISFVHPHNVDWFLTPEDREVTRVALGEIQLPASVLTNAPIEHAERVLGWLGIRDRFENVFDIRFNKFAGKPHQSAYTQALRGIGAGPETTLFVDDMLQYLIPFRDLGGHAVHVTSESIQEPGISSIRSIAELASIINSRGAADEP